MKNKMSVVGLLVMATLVASLHPQVFAGSRRPVSVTTKPVKEEKALKGKVTEVSFDGHQFKVKEELGHGGVHTVNVLPATRISGSAKTLHEIKVGDTVSVRYSYWAIETTRKTGGQSKTGLRDMHHLVVSAESVDVNSEPSQADGKGATKPKGKQR